MSCSLLLGPRLILRCVFDLLYLYLPAFVYRIRWATMFLFRKLLRSTEAFTNFLFFCFTKSSETPVCVVEQ